MADEDQDDERVEMNGEDEASEVRIWYITESSVASFLT